MPYNSNIHHRRSIRLKGYDYAQAGLYFVTICVHNRECLFGEIVGAENFLPNQLPNQQAINHSPQIMNLNDIGKFADACWLSIPKHFPNVILHEHIVMPNHVHGIIELINNAMVDNAGAENIADKNVGAENILPLQPHPGNIKSNVGVEHFQPQPKNNEPPRNEFQKIIPLSIGSIVKGFKIGVTKWLREKRTEDFPPQRPVWQRNYYEHIIRNEESYLTIANYILNNPAKWRDDKFYWQ